MFRFGYRLFRICCLSRGRVDFFSLQFRFQIGGRVFGLVGSFRVFRFLGRGGRSILQVILRQGSSEAVVEIIVVGLSFVLFYFFFGDFLVCKQFVNVLVVFKVFGTEVGYVLYSLAVIVYVIQFGIVRGSQFSSVQFIFFFVVISFSWVLSLGRGRFSWNMRF